MTALVVDAAALGEFLDKAAPLLDPVAPSLGAALSARSRALSRDAPGWPRLWDLAPGARRLPEAEREAWQPQLEPLLPLVRQGRAGEAVAAAGRKAPLWVLDWLTFWAQVADPRQTWWARWVFRPDTRTGALPLVLDDPAVLDGGTSPAATYRLVSEGTAFVGEVLGATRRLSAVEEPFRPLVALAAVYAVYLFTMTAWKMSEEFTQLLPPFTTVMKTMLGLTRWEGRQRGAEG